MRKQKLISAFVFAIQIVKFLFFVNLIPLIFFSDLVGNPKELFSRVLAQHVPECSSVGPLLPDIILQCQGNKVSVCYHLYISHVIESVF